MSYSKQEIGTGLLLGLFVLGAIGSLMYLTIDLHQNPRKQVVEVQKMEIRPKFSVGETVYAKLDGREGMVLDVYGSRYLWYYDVRFVCSEATIPSHVIGSGGKINNYPYSVVNMREFELLDKQ